MVGGVVSDTNVVFSNSPIQLSKIPTPTMAARTLYATSITHNDCLRLNSDSPNPLLCIRSQWLGSTNRTRLSLLPSNLRPFYTTRPPINAAVFSSLPISNPERFAATEEIPKWSSKAIKSFAMSELEARKIKSPTTGTEALLMGILIEGTSFSSKFLHANGITLLKVRDEILKMRGKPEMFFFSPEHPPLTEAATRALDWAIDEKHKAGDKGQITTTHLLLGVWQQVESPGYQILASLGFNDDKAKELHSLISEPGFADDL